MQKLGYLLIIVSFLAGAFLSSLDALRVDWVAFIAVIVAGVIGVWMVKSGQKRLARSDHVLAGNRADIERSLDNIIANLEKMNARREDIPPYEARFEIDRDYREDLTCFVDARQSLAHIYGLQAYADIMSAFAAGERYLNRVWSASADGYIDEVRTYIERAYHQFGNAREVLRKVHAEFESAVKG